MMGRHIHGQLPKASGRFGLQLPSQVVSDLILQMWGMAGNVLLPCLNMIAQGVQEGISLVIDRLPQHLETLGGRIGSKSGLRKPKDIDETTHFDTR